MAVVTRETTLRTAALVTIAVTISGSLLGLVRDLQLARWFGAGGATDAFLVSWTVPETAFCLLVEGAMSLLMVPLFSRALAEGVSMRDVVAATLPRIATVLVAAGGAVALAAPLLVRLIAPGLAEFDLAVRCTRLTAVTVLAFGLAGYLSAALRAHHVFAAPAAIHLAYNVGILGLMWTLHERLGVVSAAAGVAFGGVLMVLVQLPSYLRHVGLPRRFSLRPSGTGLLAAGALAPIVLYTLTRQAQVFVERFLGSSLPAGAISHLNYAQKVAQLPMLVALLLCTVSFPSLARALAAGDEAAARRRLEGDLRAVTAIVLLAVAYLMVFAPAVVRLLLQHGAFGAADTGATVAILRVYLIGLLGHAMVGVLIRPYFAAARPTWFPAAAMGTGLAAGSALALVLTPLWGPLGIAAGTGAGIALTAALLLRGLRGRVVAVSASTIGGSTARLALAAGGAALLGWCAGLPLAGQPSIVVCAAGGLVVLTAFAGLARLLGCTEFDDLRRSRRAD